VMQRVSRQLPASSFVVKFEDSVRTHHLDFSPKLFVQNS